MSDLFPPVTPEAPLAEQLRPQRVEDVVGQQHLLGSGKPLRLAIESGKLHSMILWGPPGVGKSRLSLHAAERLRSTFVDGVWFVPLAAVEAILIDAFARCFGSDYRGDYVDRQFAQA